MKKACAKEALKYIKDNTVIGLGGGSTVSFLVEYIKEAELNVKIVTPSFHTQMLCVNKGLQVIPTWSVDNVSVAFDGCDEVDNQLQALKSGGGIHTKEKIIASMADDYILLVDESKFVDHLKFNYPVTLEIFEESISYVENKVKKLGGTPTMRSSSSKDCFTISDHGLLLMDVSFEKVDDIGELNDALRNIVGVVDTSLFYNIANKALVVGENGIRLIKKQKEGDQNEKI